MTELLRFKSLTLNHEKKPQPDVIESIRSTVLGNPDGIRYRHIDSIKKIQEIKPLSYFTLRKDNALLYVMALVERITSHGNQFYYTYNVRYVTFNQSFAAKSLTAGTTPLLNQKLSNSIFKEGMRKFAENYEFSISDSRADKDKRIYYAYVEESNLRSMNFTGFFFEPVRKFTIITYSNIFPRKSPNVTLPANGELKELRTLIDSFYSKHTFYFLSDDDLLNRYYVLKINNEIVAGLKAEVVRWKIEQVPGLFGRIIKSVLPYIPGFSRIIEPDQFRFLTFDTLYCPPGNEKYLTELFSSVCARLKVYTAMIYLDKEDALFPRLNKLRKMGLLNKLYKNVNGVVLARFVNFTEEEKAEFIANPVYVSGYDLT